MEREEGSERGKKNERIKTEECRNQNEMYTCKNIYIYIEGEQR